MNLASSLDPQTDPYQERIIDVDSRLAGLRIDKALAMCFPEFSRSRVQQWIALGAVQIDGHPVVAKFKLTQGLQIHVAPQPNEAQQAFAPDDVPLNIVFEDEHLLCIDKPVGLVSHPGHGNWRNTLMNGLLFHRPASATLPRAGIVHRLDKDTSGLMVVAKTEAAMNFLVEQLSKRVVDRRYLALACGAMRSTVKHEFSGAIGRDPKDPLRMAVVASGKSALTTVDVLEVKEGKPDLSLVQCKLSTGRTHQIRVHLSHAGFPLLGDATYNREATAKAAAKSLGLQRQALHAWRLSLAHPATRDTMSFQSAPPSDFQGALNQLGFSDRIALSAAA